MLSLNELLLDSLCDTESQLVDCAFVREEEIEQAIIKGWFIGTTITATFILNVAAVILTFFGVPHLLVPIIVIRLLLVVAVLASSLFEL